MVTLVFKLVVLIILFTYLLVAQEGYSGRKSLTSTVDSLRQQNFVTVGFDKSFNTYHWDDVGFYQNSFGPLSLLVNGQFLSTLIRTDRKFITDQQSLDLLIKHRITSSISALGKTTSFIVSDDRSINLSKTSTQTVYGGIEYLPAQHVVITPMIGLSFDDQLNQSDHGISMLIHFSADSIDYNGYHTQFAGRWQYDHLNPRALETRNAIVSIGKKFFEETGNSLQFLYNRIRRDIYFPADPLTQQQFNTLYNIETRTEDAFAFTDSLKYSISRAMLLSVQGNLFSRSIGRRTTYSSVSTTIDELRLESSALMNYSPWKSFQTSVGFLYQERDEKHTVDGADEFSLQSFDSPVRTEERKNNHARRTALTSSMNLGISPSHIVTLSGSANLLRYDTPSIDNDDDRDELWYIVSLISVHRINQYFTLRVLVDANLMHLVYLSSNRSADNTWNRILRLSPKLEYVPSKIFSTTNTFEVLANYTAYDFEYPSAPIRSFAFRQFAFIDSSSLALSGRLRFEWFSHLRLYEQGELQWDAFSERPVTYAEDKMYTATLWYALQSRLLFSVGIRYFSQLRYSYNGDKKLLDRSLRSIGPVSSIQWTVSERTDLAVKGWYETQTQTDQSTLGFANMTMSLIMKI
jgi:hypothetical protein